MGTMTVRNIDDDIHRRIKISAAHAGMSAEAFARKVLSDAVKPKKKLGTLIHEYAQSKEMFDLDIVRDQEPVRAASFE